MNIIQEPELFYKHTYKMPVSDVCTFFEKFSRKFISRIRRFVRRRFSSGLFVFIHGMSPQTIVKCPMIL